MKIVFFLVDGEFHRFLFVVYKDGMCIAQSTWINHDFFNYDFNHFKLILKNHQCLHP